MTTYYSNIRKSLLKLVDIFTMIVAYIFVTFIITKVYRNPDIEVYHLLVHGLLLICCLFISQLVFRVYKGIWRYASSRDYLILVISNIIGGVVFWIVERVIIDELLSWYALPFSHMFLIVMFSLLATIGVRLLYQVFRPFIRKNNDDTTDKNGVSIVTGKKRVNIAIIGAGSRGVNLVEALRKCNTNYVPYCFFDTDKQKAGGVIRGIKIYLEDENVAQKIKSMPIDEIVIAMNNLSMKTKEALFDLYAHTGLKVRIFESPLESSNSNITKPQIRDMNIEDLLCRYSIEFGNDNIVHSYYGDKTILITGGGGSIGSELCRQIAKLHPKKLVIVDIYENNAYDIQQELINIYTDPQTKHSLLDMSVEIASVRDYDKINRLFAKYKPQIVFHAAAHKHVPLMENCCDEAIKNNVLGTYNVANAAEANGVSKFIMISTDKAVNPTNVMGASKRMCEMIIQSKKDSTTDFVAVRFGNVLGSNGSVIPLFIKQIEKGGPITITDERIVRYFMTIPEAAQLVLQAGVAAAKSEIYVLDMGKPMKILDLAKNMIKLAGYKPYEDIDIVEIGLRPGEKLYEELLIKTEELDKTDNEKIFIERDNCITRDDLEQKLAKLKDALETKDNDIIRSVMKSVIPTYRDANTVNREAENAEEMHRANAPDEVLSQGKMANCV